MNTKAKQQDNSLEASPDQSGLVDNPDHKMQQIRELMFGGHLRDLERRISDLAVKLEGDLAAAAQALEQKVAALDSRVGLRLDQLSHQNKLETAARKSAIDDLDERLSRMLRAQRDELASNLDNCEQQMHASDERLRASIEQLDGQTKAAHLSMRDLLTSVRMELSMGKVGREDFADMLAELALRLRADQGDSAPR